MRAGKHHTASLNTIGTITEVTLVRQGIMMTFRRHLTKFFAFGRPAFFPSATQNRNRRSSASTLDELLLHAWVATAIMTKGSTFVFPARQLLGANLIARHAFSTAFPVASVLFTALH